MKTFNYLIFVLIAGVVFFLVSCEKDDPIGPDDPGSTGGSTGGSTQVDPPTSNFSFQNGSAVVNESFKFTNTSSGKITSYYWNFGSGEGTSPSKNPTYKFKKLGNKTVTLKVTGPGGTDTYTNTLTVYAMPPDCHNYNSHFNMNEGTILNLRNQGVLEYGRVAIINTYGASIKVELYHPDSWLDEYYFPWANCYWSVPYNYPNGNTLKKDGNYFNVGGDWGIRVTFGNGVKSCIRTIHHYSKSFIHNNIKYLKVYTSDIYENSYSWNKSGNSEPPGDMIEPSVLSEN